VIARELSLRHVNAAWATGPLAVLLGAGAHLLGGDALPGPWILLAMAALLSMAASILARVKLPVWALLLVSGLIQQVLHLMFTGFSGDVGSVSPGHSHGVFTLSPPQQAPGAGGHQALELTLDAHVAAALLTVVVVTQLDVLAKTLSRLREASIRRRLPRA
jgi:hypothetical protein